jgi:hypothetical protein
MRDGLRAADPPRIDEVLADPAASYWLIIRRCFVPRCVAIR